MGMSSILGVLLSIAASYGMSEVADGIKREQSRVNGMSTDDLMQTVAKSLKKVRSKSQAAYDEAVLRLGRLPDTNQFGNLKSYISGITRKAQDAARKASSEYQETQNAITSLETRMGTLAVQPDSYKNSKSGQSDRASILRDLKEVAGDDYVEVNSGKSATDDRDRAPSKDRYILGVPESDIKGLFPNPNKKYSV